MRGINLLSGEEWKIYSMAATGILLSLCRRRLVGFAI